MTDRLEILWEASAERKKASTMQAYVDFVANDNKENKDNRQNDQDYQKLHQWSVSAPEEFWSSLFSFFSLKYEGDLRPAFKEKSFLSYTWFPKVHLNFAENLLQGGVWERKSEKVVLQLAHESGLRREMTYGELKIQVRKLQKFLQPLLIKKTGEGFPVLAAYMPNIPETVMAMLATSSLGGAFTSTSCDFGAQSVIDRFGQVSPEVLVAATGYTYQGKYFDQMEKIREIKAKIPSLKKIILVDFLGKYSQGSLSPDSSLDSSMVLWSDLLQEIPCGEGGEVEEVEYKRVPFASPLYILYSSGTTGKPKCIIHSVGGTLLQHVKELGLHSNLTSEKILCYFTTCGWMMWNWMVSGLYFGSRLILYEGSPAYPSFGQFLNIINELKINIFGTSPRFLRSLETSGERENWPKSYPSLETILSTGSPLMPEQFDFVYQKIKGDVHLASICGGTDIIGCFMLGNPLLPVYRGEIQCLGLGMDVATFDEEGREVIGNDGELVCRRPFPSCPLGFWGDDEKKTRFRESYFDHFKDVWYHGDFVRISSQKSVRVFGRSDATLNPGGVRLGTAEIYQQLEVLPYVLDGLCVGLQKQEDVEVVLFLKMQGEEQLTEERKKEIKQKIRLQASPRHVPKEIYQVKDIPYTRSGKKMELLVARIFNRRPLANLGAVANPECLQEYEKLVEIL